MEPWLRISLLLSTYGFLKEVRLVGPFIHDYLTSPFWNLTTKVVQEQVMPVTTYSYLGFLVVVFLMTDLVRYKPVIVVMAFFGVIMYSLYLWMHELVYAQIAEALHGAYQAGEVAYFTYIYAKVPKEYYREVTSHTRAAALAGRFISGAIAQILVYVTDKNYQILNIITLSSLALALLWVIFLPQAEKSIYFNRDQKEVKTINKYRNAFDLMRQHFVDSFSMSYVLKWSIWWAFATAGFLQVKAYSQPMWSVITNNQGGLHNGAVEASLTLLGFLSALSTGYLKIDWERSGALLLSVGTIVQGGLMILCSTTHNIYVGYGCYVVFGGLYYFMITIAAAEVAKHIVRDSYGLVFGLNTMLALFIQSLLTISLVTVIAVNLRDQFLVYGLYHICIALIFMATGIISCIRR